MRSSWLRINFLQCNAGRIAFAPALLSSLTRAATFVLAVALVLLTSGLSSAQAQSPAISLVPVINTVAGSGFGAGTGSGGYTGDNQAAINAELSEPGGMVLDAAGNLYIADTANSVIRKVTPGGIITTFAGNGTVGFGGDGGAATSAALGKPTSVALDSAANLYIADTDNNRIRKVNTTTGVITTVAGGGSGCTGQSDTVGDGCAATSANLTLPSGVALDRAGNIYIADTNDHRVRKVTASSGLITTVAGTGKQGSTGDNAAATSAKLNYPMGVWIDSAGNIYIADTDNNRIRKVTVSTGVISTVAGGGSGCSGQSDSLGDGCTATKATLSFPQSVVLDGAGNLYIADSGNNLIREVSPASIITAIVGDQTGAYNGDGLASAVAEVNNPLGVAVDSLGNLYIADTDNQRIRQVLGLTGMMDFPTTAIGAASSSQNVLLSVNSALTISSIGTRQSQGGVQEFTTGALSGCVADGATTNAAGSVCTVPVSFQPGYPGARPVPLAVQTSAGLFQFTLQGTGTGPMLSFAPGVISTSVSSGLTNPTAAASDSAGNLYIADQAANVVLMVAPGGAVTTVAGNGTPGFSGDNSSATSAELNNPSAVAVDGAGNLYIADKSNNRVRKVSGGVIATVAGNGTAGYSGDSSSATSAEINNPLAVALDLAGNLYIADTGNSRIRKVSAGIITTVAGTGSAGYNADNIQATTAKLNVPSAVVTDASGNLYITDSANFRIRKVTPAGIITTFAGNGTSGYSGDGSPATSAELNPSATYPSALALDAAGNLYIADTANGYIRKVSPAGIITAVAGNGTSSNSGDGGPATSAGFAVPTGIALDSIGNLYIVDEGASVLRKVDLSDAPSLSFASTDVGAASAAQDLRLLNLGNALLTISQISTAANFSLGGADTSCAISNQSLAAAASCVLGIEFNPVANGNITGAVTLTDNTLNAGAAQQSIVLAGIGVAPQSITFPNPGSVTYGVAPITLTATASSGLTVSYAVTSGPATVNGNVLTITGAGDVTVQATQAGDFEFSAAPPVNVTFTVKATQTITFPNPGAQTYGVAPITLSATATSGLTVSYTVLSGPATVSANTLTITGAGQVTVQAAQGGDSNNAPAPPVSDTFTVNKAAPTVTFTGAPATAMYSSSFTVATSTNATSQAVITVSGACTSSGTTITMSAPTGACVMNAAWATDANYLAASASQSATAILATPGINWPTPAAITYGTALGKSQLNAIAAFNGTPIAGAYTYLPASGAVLTAGQQPLSVSFVPNDTVHYTSATGSTTLTVNKAVRKITWPTPTTIAYGTALSSTQLNATDSISSSCTYSPAAGAVPEAGRAALSVTCVPTDSTDYQTQTVTVSLRVIQATPTISWATPAPVTYGTALDSTQLNATPSVPSNCVYSPAAGKVPAGGPQTLRVTCTPVDSRNYMTVRKSVILQVNSTYPTIEWNDPTAITYGALLSRTQLNAKAVFNGTTVGGTFVYSPPVGTLLSAGTQTLSVVFTPSNSANYSTPLATTVTLQVNPAKPKITWPKPASIPYGIALDATQLNASAAVGGTFTYSPAAGTVLPTGIQTLSVTFTPSSANYVSVTATTMMTVTKAGSTTTITGSSPASPSRLSQPLTVNFTVAGPGAPTGTVTVKASTGELCSGTLTAGAGSCSLKFSKTGPRTIGASYGGDTNFLSSTSAPITQVVQP